MIQFRISSQQNRPLSPTAARVGAQIRQRNLKQYLPTFPDETIVEQLSFFE
ncbi:MAG: hypothetical protein IPP88_11105 [Betaproteobacteria bacterium]|nr:hypothetical protein [Betaproteobacteria bacterium]